MKKHLIMIVSSALLIAACASEQPRITENDDFIRKRSSVAAHHVQDEKHKEALDAWRAKRESSIDESDSAFDYGIQMFAENLKLNPDQVESVIPIIQDSEESARSIYKEHYGKGEKGKVRYTELISELNSKTTKKLGVILTEEQLVLYIAIKKEADAQFSKAMGGGKGKGKGKYKKGGKKR